MSTAETIRSNIYWCPILQGLVCKTRSFQQEIESVRWRLILLERISNPLYERANSNELFERTDSWKFGFGLSNPVLLDTP